MNHYDSIKRIANHYGFRHQGRKLAEECSELSVAMLKYLDGEAGRSAVIEEMADVRIMSGQMQYLMRIDRAELQKAMEAKVERQIRRMKSTKALDKFGKSSIMKNHQIIDKLQRENQWYQELYDKSRKAQIASAEEAEALRRENEQLRAALQERRGA